MVWRLATACCGPSSAGCGARSSVGRLIANRPVPRRQTPLVQSL